MPWRASQVLAKFARDSLANVTPTFFRQCIQMHATLPPSHDLFTSSVETATITPTHALLLAVGLHQSICSLRQLRTPLPRPVSQLGLWHKFVVATREEEAFDLVDSDGGTSSWVTSQVFMTTYYRQGLQPSCGRRACMAIWFHSGAMGMMPWSLSTCTTAQTAHTITWVRSPLCCSQCSGHGSKGLSAHSWGGRCPWQKASVHLGHCH